MEHKYLGCAVCAYGKMDSFALRSNIVYDIFNSFVGDFWCDCCAWSVYAQCRSRPTHRRIMFNCEDMLNADAFSSNWFIQKELNMLNWTDHLSSTHLNGIAWSWATIRFNYSVVNDVERNYLLIYNSLTLIATFRLSLCLCFVGTSSSNCRPAENCMKRLKSSTIEAEHFNENWMKSQFKLIRDRSDATIFWMNFFSGHKIESSEEGKKR